ncbi:UNVERIFIED_ORG: hypothetical protein M2193_004609 [Bradyrhizobium japonicum]|uniref:hypothetical protein n=1 Tax=Bradyrhizobium diazoefficiens TaxID=1355477 RepID=UPI00347571A3
MRKVAKAAVGRQSDTYRSGDFRRRVFANVGRDSSDVAICVDALLDDRRIPIAGAGIPAVPAVWSDAACVLAAVAGRQRRPESVLRVTTRICTMPLRFDIGRRGRAAGNTFGSALADLLRRLHAGAAPGLPDSVPLVTVTWSDGGAALFGTIDFSGMGGGKRLYSDARLPLPPDGDWDFVQLPTVGGSLFSSPSIVGLSEIFGGTPLLASAGKA